MNNEIKKGDIVWIKNGNYKGRDTLPDKPIKVEVTEYPFQKWSGENDRERFRALPTDKNLSQNDYYWYDIEEIFQPSTRKGNFIGGYQIVQQT